MPVFADIIIPFPLQKLFIYKVPEELISDCLPGKRAIVQFGSKRIYTGLIRNVHFKKPDYETKNILAIIDKIPIISKIQFQFWDWIVAYYMCSYGDIFKAALPAGLKLQSQTNISISDVEQPDDINEKEKMLFDVLHKEKSVNIKMLEKKFDYNIIPTLKKLIDRKLILSEEHIKETYKKKTEIFIKLSDKLYDNESFGESLNRLKNAPKQTELLLNFTYIAKYGSELFGGIEPANKIKKSDLLKHSKSSPAILNELIKKGYLIAEKTEVNRLIQNNFTLQKHNVLNQYQKKALLEIRQLFLEKDVVLLKGVTASGKTEIYIKLIKEQIDKGKQVLYLLPEIALTTQIINRLKNIFGDKAGVYHSKFSDAERVEIWNNLQNYKKADSYKIILGVRSSIFLPFRELGLIIIDEEHDTSYKQFDPAPRYNARDAAVVLAKLHGVKVLQGTATPSIESFFNAKIGKFGLVEINNRYKNIQLPEIIIADMREARRRKQMKSLFTPLLLESIKTALSKKEQIILFQNRRGFSPFLECETCGWIPKCKNCDVSLTYHKYSERLVCHYCAYSYNVPKECLACGEIAIITRGFGTEKIENEINKFFPDAVTSRMDYDSTRSKKAFHNIIYNFENRKTDILIGTQMVSKGLDFDNVGIVGIINANNLLNFQDFRAFERAYQLMAQVSGRAGRKNKQGKVIIQTSDKKHTIIKDVIKNDYENMFETQLTDRQQFKYPPFYRIIIIKLKHKKEKELDYTAEITAKKLRKVFGERVLGPEYQVIRRIKNLYIKNILIKIEKKRSTAKAKKLIIQTVNSVKAIPQSKYVNFIFDVDPM